MPISNSDNLFGVSDFIVGPVLGAGCSYSTIQSALTAASAGDCIYIRPGTYTENLVLKPGVSLIGCTADGRDFTQPIAVVGTHTLTGNGFVAIDNLSFSNAIGDTFTVTSNGGENTILVLKFCQVTSVASSAMVLTSAGGNPTTIIVGSNLNSSSSTIIATGANVFIDDADLNSSTGSAVVLNGSSALETHNDATLGGNVSGIIVNNGGAFADVHNSEIRGLTAASIQFVIPGFVNAHDCVMDSGNGTGFYISGSGNYSYAGDIAIGSATQIDPLVTQTPFTWRPFGTTTGVRGTATYDPSDFSVTNGFVNLNGSAVANTYTADSGSATPSGGVINIIGGPGVTTDASGNTVTINSVVWTDRIVSALVSRNTGTFDASAGTATFTLPAAPNQGDECRFVCINSGGVIQANAGQNISIGNQTSSSGGTATSNAGGDSLWLTFNAGTLRWFSVATNGNWTVA